jgi:hypothetical protein
LFGLKLVGEKFHHTMGAVGELGVRVDINEVHIYTCLAYGKCLVG